MAIWGPKITLKMRKKSTKIGPGGSLGPPWANRILILNPRVHFGAHFGTRPRPKNASFCKKGASKHDIYVIFVESAVFLDFGFDFGSIFHQNSMCFFDVFALPLAFFLNAATFTIVCILQCFEQFSRFPLFYFLAKKCPKNRLKMHASKIGPK